MHTSNKIGKKFNQALNQFNENHNLRLIYCIWFQTVQLYPPSNKSTDA